MAAASSAASRWPSPPGSPQHADAAATECQLVTITKPKTAALARMRLVFLVPRCDAANASVCRGSLRLGQYVLVVKYGRHRVVHELFETLFSLGVATEQLEIEAAQRPVLDHPAD